MSVQKNRIRKIDFFKVYLRSFFLQAVWNYRSLISVGFDICLIPIVKRLYPDMNSRRAFLLRHIKFFNSHPYMASYALGVSIKLEEEIAAGNPDVANQVEEVKEMLTGPLGQKGDQLFWLTIKPFSLIFGVLGLFVLSTIELKLAVLAATFIIYNIPHFYLRYAGLVEGYEYGLEVYKKINVTRFENLRKMYLYIGLSAFSIFVLSVFWYYYNLDANQLLLLLSAGLVATVIYKLSHRFYITVLLTLAVFIMAGFIFF